MIFDPWYNNNNKNENNINNKTTNLKKIIIFSTKTASVYEILVYNKCSFETNLLINVVISSIPQAQNSRYN